jgi:uncharacterized protein (DUF433 family)
MEVPRCYSRLPYVQSPQYQPLIPTKRRDWLNEVDSSALRAAEHMWPASCHALDPIVLWADSSSATKTIKINRSIKALQQLNAYVDIDENRQGGTPVLRGTRFTISQLFSELAEGDSVEEIAENLDLDKDQLVGFLHAFSIAIDRPAV